MELITAWPAWCCPYDLGELTLEGGSLRCGVNHCFAVRDAIPRFVASETYADAFGAQWNRYRRTQLDSYTGSLVSETRLRRCMGEELWKSIAGMQVLECGCGAGRFTEVMLKQGACVTSTDLSDAVDANQLNCPQGTAHRIAQADIMNMPFRQRQFDIVLCLGVIQHTPDPELTIAALYEQVAPGGQLVVDHYSYSLARFTRPSQLPRLWLRLASPETGLRQTEALVNALLPLHKRMVRVTRLLSRVSPVNSYYHLYPQLPDETQREWALLDTHDHLTDRYKRLRSARSIRRTLERLGAVDVRCERGGNGVEARARRPGAG